MWSRVILPYLYCAVQEGVPEERNMSGRSNVRIARLMLAITRESRIREMTG